MAVVRGCRRSKRERCFNEREKLRWLGSRKRAENSLARGEAGR